uniref:MFS domain-containing protein n=1 Tax=Steinernema glaseri TaxID=37863 RepID=A0A1I8AIF1_9BILA
MQEERSSLPPSSEASVEEVQEESPVSEEEDVISSASEVPSPPPKRPPIFYVSEENLPRTFTDGHHRTPHLSRSTSLDHPPARSPVFRIGIPPPDYSSKPTLISYYSQDSQEEGDLATPSVLFPSMRLLVAALLSCCFIALSISSSNMAVALICMTSCPIHGYGGELEWESDQEGLVLAAQNAGSLLMVVTGMWADRINGKWMVGIALVLCTLANAMLPLLAANSFWYAVAARLMIGMADACLMPAVNSLITRWFPQKERAAAIGIITGGRQIGTLFILPTAGYLCTRKDIKGGWPAIFYLSSIISLIVAIFWLPMGADKPSKQYCISRKERLFIESRIACESIGKRTEARRVPWNNLLKSSPLWAAIFALVCHEYPLVIMLQFLPNYMRDVLEFTPAKNGIISAMPILFLFLSKTIAASCSSWLDTHTTWGKTRICKVFNGVASGGLAVCTFVVPFCDKDRAVLAIAALCMSMFFAGLHTPGVITAMVQLAPPFSGIITGISFFIVAWFGIGNKILTKWIVQHGSQQEWAVVFYVSAFIAALPIIVFSIWGSAERQWWAAPSSRTSVHRLNQSSNSLHKMGLKNQPSRCSSVRKSTSSLTRSTASLYNVRK